LDSQDLSCPRLGESHHLPHYSILCTSAWGPHSNGILSQDSQMGVSKFPKLGFLRLWGPITLCANLWLRWGLKQSYSPCRDLSKKMSHATYTQGNQVDSKLLVVNSQIANLTPGLSFGHELCFRCPNGSCEPILNIYVSIAFSCYKNSSIEWVLTPAFTLWKFGSPFGLQLPKWEFTWECEGSFPHTLLHSREHEMWPLSFPLRPQPCEPLPWLQAQDNVTLGSSFIIPKPFHS